MDKRILVIEDEKDITDLLKHYLEREGFRVEVSPRGDEGMKRAAEGSFDLILLDLLLPGMDGLEICRLLRSRPKTAFTPVIMITAKGEEADRIVGLEMGADDYVTKPFSPREVVARAKALFRRTEKSRDRSAILRYGGISLDPEGHEVTYQGKVREFTSKEFALLNFFLANPGRLLSRDLLLNEIWGYDYFGTTRTVDVHVARLRQKIPLLGQALISVKGLGYKLLEKSPKS